MLILAAFILLICSATKAQNDATADQCPPDYPEQSGVQCLKRCDEGFDGVGPFCQATCPTNTADDGASACAKMRYKRSTNNEKGATIYRQFAACKTGYRLEHGECVAICPQGSHDTGAHCSRRQYKRGFGSVLSCFRLPSCSGVNCFGLLNVFRTYKDRTRISRTACLGLYAYVQMNINALSNVQNCLTSSWKTVSLSVAFGGGVGVAATGEVGVAIDRTQGKGICYIGGCAGFKTDVSIGADVAFGVWKSLDSIPGNSVAYGGGLDIPLTEIGGSIAMVKAGSTHIGTTFSIGVGFGIMPIEIGVYNCHTPPGSVVEFNL